MAVVHTTIHEEAIVFDAACAILSDERYIDVALAGGVTAAAPTVSGGDDNCGAAMIKIAHWLKLFQEHSSKLLHINRADDFRKAKASGKLGIVFHFQNSLSLEKSLELVDVYSVLGVKVIQLTYNERNFIGDGCGETTDAGLSDFGVKAVKAMNRAGIAVDCSHAGIRTSLDAMTVSESPVIFTHANAKHVWDSNRNLTDEQIKEVARMGGVIGVNGFPAFVSGSKRPTLDDFLKHVDYIAELVGVDHVGLGLDFFLGQAGVVKPEEEKSRYQALIASGRWKADSYPPPPYYYPEGIEDPGGFPNVTEALIQRGYTVEETRKILGENFISAFHKIWK